jgi:hypothetical protein
MFSDIAPPLMAEAHRSDGGCWGDFDGDGNQDLFVANTGGTSRLWRNDGAGSLTDVGGTLGLSRMLRRATSCVFVDMDNDGDRDLYVGSRANEIQPIAESKVFENRGGTFVDVTASAGMGMPGLGVASSDWADYDDDGDYDAFVAVRWGRSAHANAFFEQLTPLIFRDTAAAKGLADPPGPQTAFLGSWFDYDADGDLDLLVAIDFWGLELYRNDAGAFTRVTTTALPQATDSTPGAPPNNAMGVTWGDYDADGCMDVFISGNNLPGQGGFEAIVMGDLASRLYRNHCDGTFSDVTRAVGLRPTGVIEWGGQFIDFDNDGDLDLSVVAGNADKSETYGISGSEGDGGNGEGETAGRAPSAGSSFARQMRILLVSGARRVLPASPRLYDWLYRYEAMIPAVGTAGRAAAMPNFLYKNLLVETGSARFVNVINQVGAGDVGATRGSAWADFDNDGDLDWFVPNRGTPNRLFRNDGPVGHYLRVHLVGARLRDAVGAWVKIRAGGREQVRHVHVLDGYLSQSQMDPHFGLGTADRVDEVWVRWAGTTQWLLACSGVPANKMVTIPQGGACRW